MTLERKLLAICVVVITILSGVSVWLLENQPHAPAYLSCTASSYANLCPIPPVDVTIYGIVDCTAYSTRPDRCGLTSLVFQTFVIEVSGVAHDLNFTATIFYRFVPDQTGTGGFINATFYRVVLINFHNYYLLSAPHHVCGPDATGLTFGVRPPLSPEIEYKIGVGC